MAPIIDNVAMQFKAYQDVMRRLRQTGWPPRSRIGRIALFLVAMDLFLWLVQKLKILLRISSTFSLSGWIRFLTLVCLGLLGWKLFWFLREKLLWRLRNRLIVTYVFIGVIPLILLVTLALTAFYLFAGQFATFVVTSGLNSELRSVEAANSALAYQMVADLRKGQLNLAALAAWQRSDKAWADRQVTVWRNQQVILNVLPPGVSTPPAGIPSFLKTHFSDLVRDHEGLFLRAAESLPLDGDRLTMITSEPLDERLLENLAADLGQITLYTKGLSLKRVNRSSEAVVAPGDLGDRHAQTRGGKRETDYVLDTGKASVEPTVTAGSVPAPAQRGDRRVTFATSLFVVNWDTGETNSPAAVLVQTRLSMLYNRLFAALGEFAPAIEVLLVIMIVAFAVIECFALLIGLGLARTITRSVAELYQATQQVNRGDLSHRILVKSKDQLAALEASFNHMTGSLEKLLVEQKEKQRMENELLIAHQVQEQLFPKEFSQLASLEVHGFCQPARTVSGDYYDFLTLNSNKLTLAVGDVSGKGISAALLMATIHSAVRAFALEPVMAAHVPVAASAAAGSCRGMGQGWAGLDVSPAALLSLLNHHLYQSTPLEKYATLFLGIYDGRAHTITYSNGGHLPPVILSPRGPVRRLDVGGTVVGLFDNLSYEQGTASLEPGDIFLAYSDGVTEPENDFGEFGEERLIELVRENQRLPLLRIREIVAAAVHDWIGAGEQPDDITLVLARAHEHGWHSSSA